MRQVSKAELIAMNGHMSRCALELMDARIDVIVSACLVAIRCQGPGFHRTTEAALREECLREAPDTAIVTALAR